MLLQSTPQRVMKVTQQVEAVSDLDGTWCSCACSFRIRSGPIAADDLDARMGS